MGNRVTNKSQSGFITEPPKSITEDAMDQGLGTPESPVGASTAGSTAKQQDMTGTPAQQQNARDLRQERRYDKKPADATQQQEAAKDTANTLAQLGPVRARVQGMIEQRLQNVQQQQGQIQANYEKLDTLDQTGADTAAARAALDNYINGTGTVQQFFDELAQIDSEGTLTGGGISGYLSGPQDVIEQMAQGQLTGYNLGEIAAQDPNIDVASIEAALGPNWQSMSLEQLDAAIDQIEAQELNRVEMIRNQLADPTLSEQRRQQLRDELNQLSGAGITGAEAGIDQLEDQIAAGNTFAIGDQEFTLEELLSDEGMSNTIAQAVQDPEALEDLKGFKGYEQLAEWIETNMGQLQEVVADYQSDAGTFLDVQDEYQQVINSLGNNPDLVASVLGLDNVPTSMTQAQLDELNQQIADSELFSLFQNDPDLRMLAENEPEMMDSLRALDSAGIKAEDMEDVLAEAAEMETDEDLADLLGWDGMPVDSDDWEAYKDNKALWDELDIEIEGTGYNAQALLKPLLLDGTISLEDASNIANADNAELILEDLAGVRDQNKQFSSELVNNGATATIMSQLFGIVGEKNFPSADDLNFAMTMGDEETANAIKFIFDLDGDGEIQEDEAAGSKTSADRLQEYLGLNDSAEDIIGSEGAWNPDKKRLDAPESLEKATNTVQEAMTNEVTRLSTEAGAADTAYKESFMQPPLTDPNYKGPSTFNSEEDFNRGYQRWKVYDEIYRAHMTERDQAIRDAKERFTDKHGNLNASGKAMIQKAKNNFLQRTSQLKSDNEDVANIDWKKARKAVKRARTERNKLNKQHKELERLVNQADDLDGQELLDWYQENDSWL